MTAIDLMTTEFIAPSTEGKPPIKPWIPPPATKEDLDFAKLHTIELALMDSSDPADIEKLVATVKEAISEDGFLYVVNYGISLEQVGLHVSAEREMLITDVSFIGNSRLDSFFTRTLPTQSRSR